MARRYSPNWFVAFPIAAESWLQKTISDIPSSVQPFVPSDVHLTIAFFGGIKHTAIENIKNLLPSVRFHPFKITFGKLRPLPSAQRVSALSFELAEGRDVAARYMQIWTNRLLEAADCPPDTRSPLPHVTIARPKRSAGEQGRYDALAWAALVQPPATSIIVDRIALYTWAEDRRRTKFAITQEHRAQTE